MPRARVVVGGKQLLGEIEKRRLLKAELAQLAATPLNPGVKLSKRERERIEEKVRCGLINQSLFPRGASVRSGDN
jgi:hypothetical protein